MGRKPTSFATRSPRLHRPNRQLQTWPGPRNIPVPIRTGGADVGCSCMRPSGWPASRRPRLLRSRLPSARISTSLRIDRFHARFQLGSRIRSILQTHFERIGRPLRMSFLGVARGAAPLRCAHSSWDVSEKKNRTGCQCGGMFGPPVCGVSPA